MGSIDGFTALPPEDLDYNKIYLAVFAFKCLYFGPHM